MGQATSLDATIDTVQHEFRKHSKVFAEINSLEFSDFLKCILELNELCVVRAGLQTHPCDTP